MQARWINTATAFTKQYSPEILSGLAVAGVIGTAILAVRATPRAMEKLDEIREEDPAKVVLRKQVLAATWKFYIPAGLSAAGTIACVIGASRIGSRRNAALAAGMVLADRAFQEYKDEVKELIGERKELEVRENAAQKAIDEHPPTKEVLVVSEDNDQLCYDKLTGRYFRSTMETIRRAENEVNAEIIRNMWAPHNDFYDLVGLPTCQAGEELGWNMDRLIKLVFTSHLTPEGVPCLAIDYEKLPIAEYGKVF